jgi:hypothetical protein
MTPTFSKQQAADAVAAARGEREIIQANLLELDASFGKRLLAGAELSGQTKQRWAEAAAVLASLWEVYSAYSAVIDRAAKVLTGRPGPSELAEITALMTGPSIQLTRPAPLARRDLADAGHQQLTLASAVTQMRRAFAIVTVVVSAAEQVWNEMATRLDGISAELDRATSLAAPLGDEALTGELAQAQAELAQLRGVLNSDPLALRFGDGVDTSGADRLRGRATALAARSADLARLRDDARQRVDAVHAAAAAARAAREDAAAACRRAAAEITAVPRVPADRTDLFARVAALDTLLAAGRWTRLSSELDLLDRELASAASNCRDTERTVAALLSQRDELRGLLGAYKAKAARLGAAEDLRLAARYDRARELLKTAPCDLAAATAAVTGYQQAVLAIGAQRLWARARAAARRCRTGTARSAGWLPRRRRRRRRLR